MIRRDLGSLPARLAKDLERIFSVKIDDLSCEEHVGPEVVEGKIVLRHGRWMIVSRGQNVVDMRGQPVDRLVLVYVRDP